MDEMGVDFYVVNHERKTGFECGKNHLWKEEFDPLFLCDKMSMELWIDDIYSDRKSYPFDNGWGPDYIGEIARRLAIFVGNDDRSRFSVVDDDAWCELEGQGYKVTNGRFLHGDGYTDLG
jgi:hypothetical protein